MEKLKMEYIMKHISHKWYVSILLDLEGRDRRFRDFLTLNDPISTKVLVDCLEQMEALGLIQSRTGKTWFRLFSITRRGKAVVSAMRVLKNNWED